MRGVFGFCLCVLLGLGPLSAAGVVEQARNAAEQLQKALSSLDQAKAPQDQIEALSQTILAYEAGLVTLRDSLRQVVLRERDLLKEFEAKQARQAQLLSVLAQLEKDPSVTLFLHPEGPLGAVRSGMVIADMMPVLAQETDHLRRQLEELRDLRVIQQSANDTLHQGLQRLQKARTELSLAMMERQKPPRRFTEDPAVLKDLLQSADTLDAFASGLAMLEVEGQEDFGFARGQLPLPVQGRLVRGPNEVDGAGMRRPGIVLAAPKAALVRAPWSGTVRYKGPLLNFGTVVIIEPGAGYLLVLAGLGTVYADVGDILTAGMPLGLMSGAETASNEFVPVTKNDGQIVETETLYIELRQGNRAIDPMPWFLATAPLAKTQQEP